jgi:leader peptidase (prepilin peptidase)/N-methyltransferase
VGPVSFGFILGITYLVTKRRGMGTGDIQLSAVLGAWQGPVNIILIFFMASFISLLTWFVISLFKGFNKDRALPFAPFLVISSITLFLSEYYFKTDFLSIILK